MKNKTFFLFLFLILIYSMGFINTINLPLLGKKIYIDPGHGGKDPGAIKENIKEKDLNLKISLNLKKILEQNGAIVYMTRDEDYDLSTKKSKRKKLTDLYNRVKLINNSDADLYLSIHLNVDKSKLSNGAQVFYSLNHKNNKELARIFQNNFNKNLGSNRIEKEITNRYLYKNIKKQGLLLELGFLSNKYEREKLLDNNYQNKIVVTIKESLIEYFNCKN